MTDGITSAAGSDIQSMDDPTFLAERSRVREMLHALQERMQLLDDEFIQRASLAWASQK
jgi:hypothetical protein